MGKFRSLYLLVVPISFCIGLWWSLHTAENLKAQAKLAPQKLRILSLPGIIPNVIIKDFEKNEHVSISLIEIQIDAFFENLSANIKQYDMFAITSYYSQELYKSIELESYGSDQAVKKLGVLPDFLEMGVTNDKAFIPVTWGINGITIPNDFPAEKINLISKIKENPIEVALFANSEELFSSLNRIQAELNDWVLQGNISNIEKSLKDHFNNVSFFKSELLNPKTFEKKAPTFIQSTNGQWAFNKHLNSKRKFLIPEDGATLWVDLLAINTLSNKKSVVHKFVAHLLNPKVNSRLVALTQKASPIVDRLNLSIPDLAKANYLKTIPLSKIDFPRNSGARGQSWKGSLQSVFPKQFKQSILVQ